MVTESEEDWFYEGDTGSRSFVVKVTYSLRRQWLHSPSPLSPCPLQSAGSSLHPPTQSNGQFLFWRYLQLSSTGQRKHNGILTTLLFFSADSFSRTPPFSLQKSLKMPQNALRTYHLFLAFQTESYSRNAMSFCIPGEAWKATGAKASPHSAPNRSASLYTPCMSASHPVKLSPTAGS